MGFDYALVHLKYTIPPAGALTFIYYPLYTRLDLYRIGFLLGIALVATTPWDSYLIQRKIWTYPPSVIIGPRLFSIPVEEVFFFAIQTYNTSIVYLLLSKAVLKPAYLVGTQSSGLLARLKSHRIVGQVIISGMILAGVLLLRSGDEGTYLGLILTWAGPFALLLWTLAYQFLGNLPSVNILLPILAPTLYLWLVDTLAMRRGTWSIESDTKLGIYIWPNLEVEEAIFFLATNILIVFGLVAFDNAMAILETFPGLFPQVPALPSPVMLFQGLLTDPKKFDNERILGIQEGVRRLQKKSRSFYLASSVFSGRLRVDLILLYSFCRVADDLVDNADSERSARAWISKLQDFLNKAYQGKSKCEQKLGVEASPAAGIILEFPSSTRRALLLLPTKHLSSRPFFDLLKGFRTDLKFPCTKSGSIGNTDEFPIKNESDLQTYASRVAGTVAELCLELVFYHSPLKSIISITDCNFLISSGARMGIALQYVNISRDVAKDAAIGRVYLPTSWLSEERITPQDVIDDPTGEKVELLRKRLLGKAFSVYEEAKGSMARLPPEARAPMRVAVESYMEIGRVLSEKGYKSSAGKATVPKMRRIRVAWKALTER